MRRIVTAALVGVVLASVPATALAARRPAAAGARAAHHRGRAGDRGPGKGPGRGDHGPGRAPGPVVSNGPGAGTVRRGDDGPRGARETVTYVVRGQLVGYVAPTTSPVPITQTAASVPPAAPADGSVSIAVSGANFARGPLAGVAKGTVLTFSTSAATRVVPPGHEPTKGDLMAVKIRAPRASSLANLEATAASGVIDLTAFEKARELERETVTYVVRGQLKGYVAPTTTPVPITGTAASVPPAGPADGSVAIAVTGGSEELLTGVAKGMVLTFSTSAATRLVPKAATPASGDRVAVVVRASRTSDLAAVEATPAVAVVDRTALARERAARRQRRVERQVKRRRGHGSRSTRHDR